MNLLYLTADAPWEIVKTNRHAGARFSDKDVVERGVGKTDALAAVERLAATDRRLSFAFVVFDAATQEWWVTAERRGTRFVRDPRNRHVKRR